ncbi:MAG: hypothetical protein AAB422_02765, partial [Planctomycetota bacterium]
MVQRIQLETCTFRIPCVPCIPWLPTFFANRNPYLTTLFHTSGSVCQRIVKDVVLTTEYLARPLAATKFEIRISKY